MRIKYKLLLFIMVSNVVLVNALATWKPEYTNIVNQFLHVDDMNIQAQLNGLKPTTLEEKAFVAYYRAKLVSDPLTITIELGKVADTYPKTEYGQRAYLDLGIRSFLQRDFDKSSAYLLKITSPNLIEKDYWLAQIYEKLNENEKAILSGQNYLKTASNPDQIENTYYIIANAYLNQAKYENVQIVLAKLDKIENLPKHKVYYNYLRGYAYDMANNDDKALEYYKSIYTLDRYSQFAFLTEDRLFAMKSRKKNHLDISFIYPDSVYHPAPELPDTTNTVVGNPALTGDSLHVETVPDSMQMVKNTGHGIFLQLGRFSAEVNAQKLMLQLKENDFNAMYFLSKTDGKVSYRVLMGPFTTKGQAEKTKAKLHDKSFNAITVTR